MRILLASTVAALAASVLVTCGWSPPPAPAQPIRFSHKVHAGDNIIGCTSCHVYAEHSPVAGIPSMQRCQGCHKFVKQDPQNSKVTQEIQALLVRLEQGTAIDWVRVYRVPDFVYFTHERHVAKGLRCQECHGEVQAMEVMRQVSPLTMGWCLDCHHARKAPIDCWICHK